MRTNLPAARWGLGGLGLACLLSACASHYSIKDPATGRTYYTIKVKRDKKAGTASFVDVTTGVRTTVTNPAVQAISLEGFDTAIHKK